jgi:hypothetical protein
MIWRQESRQSAPEIEQLYYTLAAKWELMNWTKTIVSAISYTELWFWTRHVFSHKYFEVLSAFSKQSGLLKFVKKANVLSQKKTRCIWIAYV